MIETRDLTKTYGDLYALNRLSLKLDNASLRDVDESWRINPDNDREAILIGRLAQASGLADDVTKEAASATQLWLGRLPSGGQSRLPIQGTLRQDTQVRVFIPLPAAEKKP